MMEPTRPGPRDRDRAQRWGPWLAVAAVLAALCLRLPGTGALLPARIHGDERVWAGHLQLLRGPPEAAAAQEAFGFYPHLVPRLALLIAPRPAPAEEASLEAQLEHAGHDYVLLRRLSVWIGLLAPLAAYGIARRFLSPLGAAWAAWLTATSLLATWYAPQARPHGIAAALVTLGVLACLRLRERPGWPAYLAAGAAIGTAVGVLQNAFLLLAPLLVAHVLRRRTDPRASALAAHARCAAALALVAAAVVAFYPFAFLPRPEGATGRAALGGHALLGQASVGVAQFDGSGALVLAHTLWSLDPVLCLLVVFGAAGWFLRRRPRDPDGASWRERVRRRADLWIVLAFAGPYLLAFGAYAITFPRYLLHLVPFLAIAAVAGCGAWAERARMTRRAAIAAAAASVIVPFALCAHLAVLWTRPDTLEETAAFLRARPAPTATLVSLDVPVLRSAAAIGAYRSPPGEPWAPPWVAYQSRLPDAARLAASTDLFTLRPSPASAPGDFVRDAAAGARALGARRLLLDASDRARRPPIARLCDALSDGVVARFSPQRRDAGDERPVLVRDQGDEWRGEASFAWRLAGARALGPVVEVHAVRP